MWYFSTWFRNCCDSVVLFDIISEPFWQCGVFRHDFGIVPTVWYFSTWFRNCFDSVVFPTWFPNYCYSVVFPTWFLNCSDSVVFPTLFLNYSGSVVFFYMISELYMFVYMIWEMFWQFDIFLHDFRTVLTVWYFSTWFRNCADSVAFFNMI